MYVSVYGLRLGSGVRSDVRCDGGSGLGFVVKRDVHKNVFLSPYVHPAWAQRLFSVLLNQLLISHSFCHGFFIRPGKSTKKGGEEGEEDKEEEEGEKIFN